MTYFRWNIQLNVWRTNTEHSPGGSELCASICSGYSAFRCSLDRIANLYISEYRGGKKINCKTFDRHCFLTLYTFVDTMDRVRAQFLTSKKWPHLFRAFSRHGREIFTVSREFASLETAWPSSALIFLSELISTPPPCSHSLSLPVPALTLPS